ncbi:MAG TPA: NAD-dependent epimerase/dehydratase family protein, partial [Myxococcota bacterium]
MPSRARHEKTPATPKQVAPKRAASKRVVAVTGAFGSLGRRVVALLEADDSIDRVVALDVRGAAPGLGADDDIKAFLQQHQKLSAHALDLTEAGADRELGDILVAERAGSIIHLAFLSTPTHALEMAHELETIGTLYVLNAAAFAHVGSIVSLSSSMCYGAHPDNPAWIVE